MGLFEKHKVPSTEEERESEIKIGVIKKDETKIIGREGEIVLDRKMVEGLDVSSRKQAEISVTDEGPILKTLSESIPNCIIRGGSSIYIRNNQAPQQLKDGDQVRFGLIGAQQYQVKWDGNKLELIEQASTNDAVERKKLQRSRDQNSEGEASLGNIPDKFSITNDNREVSFQLSDAINFKIRLTQESKIALSNYGTNPIKVKVGPLSTIRILPKNQMNLADKNVLIIPNIDGSESKFQVRFSDWEVSFTKIENKVTHLTNYLRDIFTGDISRDKKESEKRKRVNQGNESRASISHPERNEDSSIINSAKQFLGVFDGMGGHAEGEMASRVVAGYVESMIARLDDQTDDLGKYSQQLVNILLNAKKELISNTDKKVISSEIGTTAVIAKVVESQNKKYLSYAWAGDSRLYIVKKDGTLSQLTQDHSDAYGNSLNGFVKIDGKNFPFDLSDARMINWWLSKAKSATDTTMFAQKDIDHLQNKFTEDYASALQHYWSKRNIISGGISSKPNTNSNIAFNYYEIGDDDLGFVAMSDGVHDNLSDKELQKICKKSKNVKDLVSKLVNESYKISKGGTQKNPRSKKDDITATGLAFN